MTNPFFFLFFFFFFVAEEAGAVRVSSQHKLTMYMCALGKCVRVLAQACVYQELTETKL
jgi:hypothetical protein